MATQSYQSRKNWPMQRRIYCESLGDPIRASAILMSVYCFDANELTCGGNGSRRCVIPDNTSESDQTCELFSREKPRMGDSPMPMDLPNGVGDTPFICLHARPPRATGRAGREVSQRVSSWGKPHGKGLPPLRG
ncbi:MAG: hypothetical protein AAF664_16570 [Planctomycetota bacterium]